MAVLLGFMPAVENVPQLSMHRLSSPPGSALLCAALAVGWVRCGLENIAMTGLPGASMTNPESLLSMGGTLNYAGLDCFAWEGQQREHQD